MPTVVSPQSGHSRPFHVRTSLSITTVLFVMTGCGELAEELKTPVPAESGRVTNQLEPDGSTRSTVNASEQAAWVYFRLATGAEAKPADPQKSPDCDLAFQRFQVKVNGGISGTGAVEVAVISDLSYGAIGKAPSAGYITDQADSADEDPDPDHAFAKLGPWYDYNVMTHILTPKAQVYAVRGSDGKFYKLQFAGYYDPAGSAGYPTFRWKEVMSP